MAAVSPPRPPSLREGGVSSDPDGGGTIVEVAHANDRAPAAGPKAVVNALAYTARTAGLVRGTRALLGVNQDRGFDCPGCAWPDPEPRRRSLMEFCENGARAVAHEADKRRVDRAFFEQFTISELKKQTDHFLEQQGRLTEPFIKRAGSDRYEPISYDEAIALVARELRGLSSPDRAAFYTSGRTSNEAAFLYQLFARTYGTNNLPDCSNMCHESSGKGLGSTLGIGKGTVTLDDFDKADCIFIIGQNPGTNHPRMLGSLADAARRGAKVVSINPLRERGLESFAHPQHVAGMLGRGDAVSTHYVRVRINGDVPLLKGVMKEVLAAERTRGNVLDRAFISEHTEGFDALVASLDAVDYPELERASGIDRATMRELADIYVTSQRVIVCWAMGLTQHKNGVANVREIVNLLLLRGNIGREGAGACPVRGHSNVQGDRTVGIHEAPSEAFLARLDAAVGIRSPRKHGHDVVGTIAAMERGEVDVFFAMGGNFISATPDSPRTARAMGRVRLTAQVSTKLNRSHLETGDVALILPCLGRTERDVQGNEPQFVTVENSMGIVHRSEGQLTPASEQLLSEPVIVAKLASAVLGTRRPIDWSWMVGDYGRIRDLVEKAIAGFDRYNERVRQEGGFSLPNGPRERRFTTKSSKAHFTVQALPTTMADEGRGELTLMTIRSHDQFNTTVYELHDRYRGIEGERRVVFMNEHDLRDRGLDASSIVDITSHFQGQKRTVTAFRCVPYDIPRGCAAAYFPETNPLVPLEHHADESHTPASKSLVVTVARSVQ
ncbi:MAG: FdhF/YdeP family oxidoreductase [Polyangiaceae bacterium]|nr:FdhF/YdeP family oxidoreductase [Polyangiaceae bacterium]